MADISPHGEVLPVPGNVNAATPSLVMPAGLCSAFTEELRLENYVNTYPDGSSDRAALALNVRHFFKFNRRVTAAQYTTLKNFYFANLVNPFYFYNLRETIPPWTSDPTGSNPVGRYTVCFDGSWSEQTMMGRSDVSLGLREIA